MGISTQPWGAPVLRITLLEATAYTICVLSGTLLYTVYSGLSGSPLQLQNIYQSV